MRRILCFLELFLFLATTGLLSAEQVNTQFLAAPNTLSIKGTDVAELEATRWPQMSSKSDNTNCDYKISGMSNTCKGNCIDFTTIKDLVKEYTVPADYRKTATVVVNWALRVEGEEGPCPNPYKDLSCNPYHGRNTCEYPPREVRSCLYVDGKPLGQEAVMTIPGGDPIIMDASSPPSPRRGFNKCRKRLGDEWDDKTGHHVWTKRTNCWDPTVTGSAVIKPSFFSGEEFPETIKIEIRWRNDTSMNVRSLADYHSMEIIFLPITQDKSN